MSQNLKTDAEVLQKVLDVITPQDSWCKGALFRDEDGTTSTAPEATSYCLEGALQVATNQHIMALQGDKAGAEAAEEQIRRLRKHLIGIMKRENMSHYESIPAFNDNAETTKEDALHLVKLGLSEADLIPQV